MWEWAGYICVVILLGYHSVSDLGRQFIPGRSLAAGVVLSFCWALGKGILGTQSWPAIGAGLIPGAVTLLLNRVTREQIGRGDAWELVIMGNCLGWLRCLTALGIAFLGVFCVGILLLVFGKAKRNTRIPFVPFLEAGTVVQLLCSL